MDFCVCCRIIFVFVCSNAWSLPIGTSNMTVSSDIFSIPSCTQEMMGQGLEAIPDGESNITHLNLAYNYITNLSFHIFTNRSFRTLEVIDLRENKLNYINKYAFKGLRKLRKVILAENNITTLNPDTFLSNVKLEELDLTNNQIAFQRSQGFLVSDSLETLILTDNRIDYISRINFAGVPNLKMLLLDSNEITSIDDNSFKPLTNLQYLSLSNTGVYRLSESMFPPPEYLPRIIDLESTPLSRRFDPNLTKVKDAAVENLLRFDEHFYVNNTAE